MKAEKFDSELDRYGELHVSLDDGEYHVHKHDTQVSDDGDYVVVDSRKGHWAFKLDRIQDLAYPDSEKVA